MDANKTILNHALLKYIPSIQDPTKSYLALGLVYVAVPLTALIIYCMSRILGDIARKLKKELFGYKLDDEGNLVDAEPASRLPPAPALPQGDQAVWLPQCMAQTDLGYVEGRHPLLHAPDAYPYYHVELEHFMRHAYAEDGKGWTQFNGSDGYTAGADAEQEGEEEAVGVAGETTAAVHPDADTAATDSIAVDLLTDTSARPSAHDAAPLAPPLCTPAPRPGARVLRQLRGRRCQREGVCNLEWVEVRAAGPRGGDTEDAQADLQQQQQQQPQTDTDTTTAPAATQPTSTAPTPATDTVPAPTSTSTSASPWPWLSAWQRRGRLVQGRERVGWLLAAPDASAERSLLPEACLVAGAEVQWGYAAPEAEEEAGAGAVDERESAGEAGGRAATKPRLLGSLFGWFRRKSEPRRPQQQRLQPVKAPPLPHRHAAPVTAAHGRVVDTIASAKPSSCLCDFHKQPLAQQQHLGSHSPAASVASLTELSLLLECHQRLARGVQALTLTQTQTQGDSTDDAPGTKGELAENQGKYQEQSLFRVAGPPSLCLSADQPALLFSLPPSTLSVSTGTDSLRPDASDTSTAAEAGGAWPQSPPRRHSLTSAEDEDAPPQRPRHRHRRAGSLAAALPASASASDARSRRAHTHTRPAATVAGDRAVPAAEDDTEPSADPGVPWYWSDDDDAEDCSPAAAASSPPAPSAPAASSTTTTSSRCPRCRHPWAGSLVAATPLHSLACFLTPRPARGGGGWGGGGGSKAVPAQLQLAGSPGADTGTTLDTGQLSTSPILAAAAAALVAARAPGFPFPALLAPHARTPAALPATVLAGLLPMLPPGLLRALGGPAAAEEAKLVRVMIVIDIYRDV